jgi:hypothetical protein
VPRLAPLFLILLSASVFQFAPPSFGQSELIVNGGFETGNFDGWNAGKYCLAIDDALASHSGSYMARVGSPDSWDTLSQTISISNQTIGNLSFCYLVERDARLVVTLRASDGSVIQSWRATDDSIWHEIIFHLEPTHGETSLLIEFKGVGYKVLEGGVDEPKEVYIGNAFVDDVSLTVSSEPIPEFEIISFVMVIGIVSTLIILKRRKI